MNSLLVPALLAAMVGAWLPAQISGVASELTRASCALEQAHTAPDTPIDPDRCQDRPRDLAVTLARWQALGDL
jgi:hypothetical protein